MSDLIDRQKAITAICEDGTWLESQGCTEITMCERKQRDADILSELPTIEAVEVVRCKKCEHYNAGFECLKEGYGIERNPNWFCADGERRDDERSD